jgi:hypothetical protein
MKNIHLLPTDKPSRLFYNKKDSIFTIDNDFENVIEEDWFQDYNIYITSEEEIKEGVDQWYLDKFLNKPRNSSGSQYAKKQDVIILTTDQDLIENGVQAIDDDFLEWFVENPSCERVKVEDYGNLYNFRYLILIPKEEPKQENCCTPEGQIKRYVDCKGCDRKPKQEMKQTAVEWLEKICNDRGYHLMSEYFEQAKEMEKEQIMDAYEKAEKDCGKDFLHGDLYYNETFKSE